MVQWASDVAIAPPGPAGDHQLVYPAGNYPYKKSFSITNAHWYAVLHFEVFTSYEDWSSPAAVKVNGTTIGSVPPKGYQQTNGQMAAVSYRFGTGVFAPISPGGGYTGTYHWELVPNANDYLFAGNWRIEYNKILL